MADTPLPLTVIPPQYTPGLSVAEVPVALMVFPLQATWFLETGVVRAGARIAEK